MPTKSWKTTPKSGILMASESVFFFLCSPNCPKQPRTLFLFYKLFYPAISCKISVSNQLWILFWKIPQPWCPWSCSWLRLLLTNFFYFVTHTYIFFSFMQTSSEFWQQKFVCLAYNSFRQIVSIKVRKIQVKKALKSVQVSIQKLSPKKLKQSSKKPFLSDNI